MEHRHCFLCIFQNVSGLIDYSPRAVCRGALGTIVFANSDGFASGHREISQAFFLLWIGETMFLSLGIKPHLPNKITNRQTDKHIFFKVKNETIGRPEAIKFQ